MDTFFEKDRLPYVCSPITGQTKEQIKNEIHVMKQYKPDMIEWRADFFNELDNTDEVLHIINEIRSIMDVPLLFTIRSNVEGGNPISLSESKKVDLICLICKHSSVSLVDYEACNDSEYVQKIKQVARKNGKRLILSYHNFQETPENEELLNRLKIAETYGADVAKLAVMPKSEEDVFRLLSITKQADQSMSIPVITMAMGELGRISRMLGWLYGSVLTFGVGVQSSAPGQLPIQDLKQYIHTTKQLLRSAK